mgnify:CR=1 FL=1
MVVIGGATVIDVIVIVIVIVFSSWLLVGRFSEEICEFRFHIEELVVKSLLQFAAVDVIRAAIQRNEALPKASPTDRDMFFQSILRLVRP